MEKERSNEDESFEIMDRIKELARKDPKRIVFPEAEEPRVLNACRKILDLGIAKVILVGDKKAITSKLAKMHLSDSLSKGIQIVDVKSDPRQDSFAKLLYEARKQKGMTLDKARQLLQEGGYFGTMMVHQDDADGLISGAVHSTADTLRPALQIIRTKEKFHRVSGIFIMIMKKRIMFFGDCAVEPDPDKNDLADIAIDTAETARSFGVKPKVAMLSFSTNGSAKHPMADKVKDATEIVKAKMPDLMIDGEMQVDAALVPEVCKLKFPDSKVKGDANVLIFPDLNSGNISYKLVERLGHAKAIGPIIQGLKKPVNDLSRGCSVDDIVDLTAVTVVQAQQRLKRIRQ